MPFVYTNPLFNFHLPSINSDHEDSDVSDDELTPLMVNNYMPVISPLRTKRYKNSVKHVKFKFLDKGKKVKKIKI